MTPEHTADEVPVESDGADTLSLVERLRSSDPPASATTLMLQAADEIERLQRIERNRDMWKAQCERQAERLRSQGGAPEGWKRLPCDAAPEMVAAALTVDWSGGDGDEVAVVHNVWNAMLAAAPQPPQAGTNREIDGKLYAAVLYAITCLHGDTLSVKERARLADAIVARLKERGLLPQPPEGGTGWPVLPCRFSARGCQDHAVGIFHVPQGCHCWLDPIQALCAQHACKADSPGPIECVIDFSMPSPPGQDDRTNAGPETDGSLNQSLPSALPRKDVEGAVGEDAIRLSCDCHIRQGEGFVHFCPAHEVALSAERSRVIEILEARATKLKEEAEAASANDRCYKLLFAADELKRTVTAIRDLGKQTGGADVG